MTKINLFMNISFLLIAILFSAILQCSSAISNKRLCYDPECSEPVSLARTILRYIPKEPGVLPFDVNVKVKVYSKAAGNRDDLWGVEINGKRGYAPKSFLKETKILHSDLQYEVPTEEIHKVNVPTNQKSRDKKNIHDSKNVDENTKISNTQGDTPDIESNRKEVSHTLNGATPTYEVIDGTTFHLERNEPTVQPTFVTEVVEPTTLPNNDMKEIKSNDGATSENAKGTLNVKNVTIPQEDIDSSNVNKNQSISSDININDFLASSEEVSELQYTTGVTDNAPTAGANTILENNTYEKTEKVAELPSNSDPMNVMAHEEKSKTENTETLNKIADINSLEPPVIKETTEANNENSENGNSNNNIESVSIDTPEGISKVKDSDSDSIQDKVDNNANIGTEKNENSHKLEKQDTVDQSENSVEPEAELQPVASNTQNEVDVKEEQNSNNLIPETASNNTEEVVISEETQAEEQVTPNIRVVEEVSITESPVSSESTTISNDSEQKIPSMVESSHVSENKVAENTSNTDIPSAPLDSSMNHAELTITSTTNNENIEQELSDKNIQKVYEKNDTEAAEIKIENETVISNSSLEDVSNTAESNKTIVNNIVNNSNDLVSDSVSAEVPTKPSEFVEHNSEKLDLQLPEYLLPSSQKNMISDHIANFNEFHNRNLLNVEKDEKYETENIVKDEIDLKEKTLPDYGGDISNEDKVLHESSNVDNIQNVEKTTVESVFHEVQVSSPEVCTADFECGNSDNVRNHNYLRQEENNQNEENAIISRIKVEHNYWLTLTYLTVTAVTILMFSLGYYYIENMRRDGYLIAKINKLEKDLLVSTKECSMLTENLKITKDKLTCIEDESFGSNEMVLSLKADLEASQNVKAELEDQVASLEKDLESATEAGLELERMLREVLSSNNEVNPLAQSVEDLQTRLNAQQAKNESLTNALNLKTQEHEFDKLENEALSADLNSLQKKYEELEVELTQVTENLKAEIERKNNIEQTLTDKIQQLEMQLTEISTDKSALQKQLKNKEVEIKDLVEVINQLNCNNLDLDKLYDVSHIKAEATALLEERNDLKVRLSEVEGAHNLLEEHMKIVKEEMSALTEQCKVAEKEKKDAETRLEVLSNFFKEKEAQRQKEEAIWLQKQGEVVSTVERIQAMQNEIQNYKQQIEMLKREILDQEREYKGQISLLETKAHEQWVVARQVERRLEESKAEAGQLRNRLTLIEKNINDADPDTKLHRLEANGETTTSPPLFIGAESSNSPIMFTGSSGVPPPPPPSYMHCSMFPPYLLPPLPTTSGVPPYEVGQRPPPLGGRLSSPPPMPLHPPPASNRYDNTNSPPPPMSPHLLPPFNHRSPPPPFGSDHIHPPPPPPPGSILPPPLGTTHSWGEESLPPVRNSGFHPHQREQRVRNHKGSLHSSGESLDKTHHSSKV